MQDAVSVARTRLEEIVVAVNQAARDVTGRTAHGHDAILVMVVRLGAGHAAVTQRAALRGNPHRDAIALALIGANVQVAALQRQLLDYGLGVVEPQHAFLDPALERQDRIRPSLAGDCDWRGKDHLVVHRERARADVDRRAGDRLRHQQIDVFAALLRRIVRIRGTGIALDGVEVSGRDMYKLGARRRRHRTGGIADDGDR